MDAVFPNEDAGRLLAKAVPGDNAAPLSVSELSMRLKRHVEDGFGLVRLRGEISGWKRVGSGHCYLCLKDDKAVIDGVMWKGSSADLAFAPEDGLEVIATGRLTTYPGRSKYQIVIDTMELAGEGALLALLEKLKRKLAGEGLFDASAKKRLPFMPQRIGVVTSPTGAVIRDILHRISDRFPGHVVVWPVAVQGAGSGEQVARAIEGFAAMQSAERPDLIIVARGGGSIEDLWAFNEERVVRAVAACAIPIISAVGHETDTTLCDFAADVRAPTPTAAAEMAVPVRSELAASVRNLAARTLRCAWRYHEHAAERFTRQATRWPRREALFAPQAQRTDELAERLRRSLGRSLSDARGDLAKAAGALRPAILRQMLIRDERRLEQLWRMAVSLNPDAVLARGYARVETREGKTLTTAGAVRAAGALTVHMKDGAVDMRVERAAVRVYPTAEQGRLL